MKFTAAKRAFLVDALGEARVRELEADDSKSLDELLKEMGIEFKSDDSLGWINQEMGLRE